MLIKERKEGAARESLVVLVKWVGRLLVVWYVVWYGTWCGMVRGVVWYVACGMVRGVVWYVACGMVRGVWYGKERRGDDSVVGIVVW